MILEIDGVNLRPYIAMHGVKWQRTDMEASDAGYDLNGDMRRNRMTTKRQLDITCRPLKDNEAAVVLTALMPEYVTVRFTDPQAGEITRTMYAKNSPASYLTVDSDGSEWWGGIAFQLVER